MSKRWIGCVVSGDKVTAVEATIPKNPDHPITIDADQTWALQSGDRALALWVLFQRCSNYFREHSIDLVAIKSSAVPQSSVKLAVLHSAEVRGVVLAAAASASKAKALSKAQISRNFGARKVDEYCKDDEFWSQSVSGGKLRKTSREAALLLLAARSV